MSDVWNGTVNGVWGGTVSDVWNGTVNGVWGGTVNDVWNGTVNGVSVGTECYSRPMYDSYRVHVVFS